CAPGRCRRSGTRPGKNGGAPRKGCPFAGTSCRRPPGWPPLRPHSRHRVCHLRWPSCNRPSAPTEWPGKRSARTVEALNSLRGRCVVVRLFGAMKDGRLPAFTATGAVLDLTHQLATGGIDVIAAGGAHRGKHAIVIQEFMECQDIRLAG